MRILLSFLVVLLSVSCVVPSSYAEPIKRKVLVLYNSAEERTARTSLFMEGFAMPLNYFGFLYEVRDVNLRPLPSNKEMSAFSAVFTTFADNLMDQPVDYLKWLLEQMKNDRKIIVAGALGAMRNLNDEPIDSELIKSVYLNLGFAWKGNATNDRTRLKYDYIDQKSMNFERKLPLFPFNYIHIVPSDEKSSSWVTVSLKDKPGTAGSVVGVGPKGGFALDEYMRWQDPVDYQKQWYLNPFDFLRESLGLKGIPALTPTTLNGLRVAFAHIDGDGFVGYTEIDKYKNSGEMIMERIFSRYDFPNSASVIAGEINPAVKGSLDNVEQARTLFEMNNIETSSHSYTHPFAWQASVRDSAEYSDNFIVGQYEMAGYKFDARYEIVESCEYISTDLAPAEKPCKVLLWSGMCDPTKEQVEIAEKAGILNLNGGDTVFDARRNSYFGVSPLYLELGKNSQIYTGQANENILTNLWEGPFYGFRNIIDTMKRTGSPRRVMPIDIYYHFYSGEKFASLKALEDVYEWVLSQDTANVYASAYIKMVRGYLTGKLEKFGADKFIVTDYRDCLSLRLDGMDKVPDLSKCKNIIGYDITSEGIFVHLNPDQDRAELVLSSDLNVNDVSAYIKNASGWVKDFRRTSDGAQFVFECFGKGKIVIGGLTPNQRYKVVGKNSLVSEVRSNSEGEVVVKGVTSETLEISQI
ncbi:polysaccharide deacetylase family protein [Maridesulfovibrio frigidus]|uniref:polysaccharide deacetylase family protein n=1 Tax=Maridesulfovibrio frigidus TaxID=340956 RepID=UPI0004E1C1CD|nr:polysaccharide deacetylase [Maridesulfovibrio frigidus]